MSRRKVIALRVLLSAGIFLLLAGLLLFFLPHIIRMDSIRERVTAEIQRKTGGWVEYGEVGLFLFPVPRLTVRQVRFHLSEAFSGKVASVTVFPHIRSLFRGEVKIARLVVESPALDLEIPGSPGKDSPVFFFPFQEDLGPLGEFQRREIQNLFVVHGETEIRDGSLALGWANHPDLPSIDSSFDLRLRFTIDPTGSLSIDGEGGKLEFLAIREQERIRMEARSFKGSLRWDGKSLEATLNELLMDFPRLEASGSFSHRPSEPLARLSLHGRAVDAESTRNAALVLFGKEKHVQKIFEIIRGGWVPEVFVDIRADTFEHLGKSENLEIRGRMEKGRIFIPNPGLDLTEVSGDAHIQDNTLNGKNLHARYGNSRGSAGSMRLGLKRGDSPFHLEIDVDADLSQLPPVLDRVVRNKVFKRELRSITGVEGQARGKLTLGERTKSISARVEASDLRLKAVYPRLPFPIQLRGGTVYYDSDEIAVGNLSGRCRQSSLEGLAGRLAWGSGFHLRLDSGKLGIRLEEVVPWLSSVMGGSVLPEGVSGVQGLADLSIGTLEGPLFKPEAYRYRLDGRMGPISFHSSDLAGPVRIASGGFSVQPGSLSIDTVDLHGLDSQLTVSGTIQDPRVMSLSVFDLNFSGRLAPRALRRIEKGIGLPERVSINGPVSVSHARLATTGESRMLFSGKIATDHGPVVDLSLEKTPDALEIKQLSVEDEASRMESSLSWTKGQAAFGFSGHLKKSTLAALVTQDIFLPGWLEGDIQVRLRAEHPFNLEARGSLNGGQIRWRRMPDLPVDIQEFSLKGNQDHIEIHSSDVTVKGYPMAVSGTFGASEQGLSGTLHLDMEGIDWHELREYWGKRDGGESAATRIPILFTVHVNAGFFDLGRYRLEPFRAEATIANRWLEVKVQEADLCGISLQGTFRHAGGQMELSVLPRERDSALDHALSCLMNRKGLATGNFELQGEFQGKEIQDRLFDSMSGGFRFEAENGRIYRFGLLSKIFALLNLTEILAGKVPDLAEEGFAYNSIKARGTLENGQIRLEEAVIDGASMMLAANGTIDPMGKKLDLLMLVAPLKTVDRIISYIPLVGEILGGTLISIPFSVSGDWAEPTIVPLSPRAVGTGILGMMKRTLQLPIKLIQPLLPEKEKN